MLGLPKRVCQQQEIKLVIYEDGMVIEFGQLEDTQRVNLLNLVESYDPVNDSWQTDKFIKKHWAVGWVANNKIYIAGGMGIMVR